MNIFRLYINLDKIYFTYDSMANVYLSNNNYKYLL